MSLIGKNRERLKTGSWRWPFITVCHDFLCGEHAGLSTKTLKRRRSSDTFK